jgi:hypothetical protein
MHSHSHRGARQRRHWLSSGRINSKGVPAGAGPPFSRGAPAIAVWLTQRYLTSQADLLFRRPADRRPPGYLFRRCTAGPPVRPGAGAGHRERNLIRPATADGRFRKDHSRQSGPASPARRASARPVVWRLPRRCSRRRSWSRPAESASRSRHTVHAGPP